MADYPLKQLADEVQHILDQAVLYSGQSKSEALKAVARENIGASPFGAGIKIVSHFDSLSELEAAVAEPSAGEAYSVGETLPYNLYVYDFYNEIWRDYGPIRSNDISARFAQNLVIPTSAWEQDTDVFVDYSYKAACRLGEISGNDYPIVGFSPSDAVSGNYAPICYAFDGYFEIWAKQKPSAEISIPTATFIVQTGGSGNNTKGITNATAGIAIGSVTNELLAPDAVTAEKIAPKEVTRAKLAQDALYSPVEFMETSHTVSAENLGKTLSPKYANRNTQHTVSLTQAISTTLPLGFEMAIYDDYCTPINISTNGIKVSLVGQVSSGTAGYMTADEHVFSFSEVFGTIALKKVGSSSSGGDTWNFIGNVEVVE